MLNVTHYHRNGNQAQCCTISHLSEWLLSKSRQTINAEQTAEKKGTLLQCWRQCKLVQPVWGTLCRFLKKLELVLSCDPGNPLLGIHTEETRIERDTSTPMLIITALISCLGHGRYLDIHEQMNG